jgi:feruloyl esterase
MRVRPAILVLCALVLSFALVSTPLPFAAEAVTPAPDVCGALSKLKLDSVTITAAERVGAGWPFPPSVFNIMAGPNLAARTSFCRVAATIEGEIRIEVWLPDGWNGRFEGVGNGGLTGAINYPALSAGASRGFATASTDTGHQTPTNFFDASWVDGHPSRVVNFGYRAHHLMAVMAKKIVAAYYGKAPLHSYYEGCSSGGWQGLTEAQRFPNDYDGIVAGAPAIDFVRLQSTGVLREQMHIKNPQGDLPPSKYPLLVAAATAYCDERDGLKDGLVSDPEHCGFDPATLTCKAGDGPDCLTPAQVATVRWLYGRRTTPAGLTLYPGFAWGAPPGFDIGPPVGGDSTMVRALKVHPTWTAATFDPDRDIPAMDAELGPTLDSTNPDLGAFAARGGKLILYHGWADPLLSPYNTLDYYASVSARAGARVTDFARLFMLPGVAHCRGGAGPDDFDALSAVMRWVEQHDAPSSILASHRTLKGEVDRTRPLCVYPARAVYNGSGSIDDATNFHCGA